MEEKKKLLEEQMELLSEQSRAFANPTASHEASKALCSIAETIIALVDAWRRLDNPNWPR